MQTVNTVLLGLCSAHSRCLRQILQTIISPWPAKGALHLFRASKGSLEELLHKELAQVEVSEAIHLILEQTASIKIHLYLQ